MMRHLNTQAHRTTQATTSVRDLPGWASAGLGKYTTLFFRMAYGGTRNVYRNTFKPLILGNPLPMFRLVAMGLGHGSLYWQFKHATMGTEKNNEHVKGATPERLFENAMAVETFSLFGSTMDALDKKQGTNIFQSIWEEVQPVILTNVQNIGVGMGNLYEVATNSKYTKEAKIKLVGQTFEEYTKQTLVAYNHWSKIRDNLFNGSKGKEIVRYRQASRIIRTFMDNNKISYEGSYNWDSPLYKALEREIVLGEDDIKGQTIAAELYWIARMEMRDKIIEESIIGDSPIPAFSQREADAKARKKLKASINSRLGVIPFSMNSKDGIIKRAQLKASLDDEGNYILRKATDDSRIRLLNFWNAVKEINADDRYTYW